MLWDPVASVSTLCFSALPAAYDGVWSDRPGLEIARIAADGVHGFAGPARRQIVLVGPDTGSGPLAVFVPLDARLPSRLAEVRAFWRELTGAKGPPPVRDGSPARRRRLLLGLRVLDGRAEGASHRALARALFGADRVPAGAAWKSHDLRSRILRLVREATRLRDGGYRSLLMPPDRLRAKPA